MAELVGPVLVVGAGGAGSRLAPEAAAAIGCDYVRVSNDPADLGGGAAGGSGGNGGGRDILVPTGGVVNPSSAMIRGCATSPGVAARLGDALRGRGSAVILASLAGRSGAAIAPVVSRMCRKAGIGAFSLAIMPFGFEMDRIFSSGTALKRLRADCACTVVIDNDAVLLSNPSLSPASTRRITNPAIICAAASLRGASAPPDGVSVVTAGGQAAALEEAARRSLSMLYAGAGPRDVSSSVIHVFGGDEAPVGAIDTVSRLLRGALGCDGTVDYSHAAGGGGGAGGVVMVSALRSTAKFDAYDPLGAIPAESTLDWDEPERSIDAGLDLPQAER